MASPDAPLLPLRLAVDREALVANWRALVKLSGKARAGAAVKANGYGVGARLVVETLARAGCRDFFVAYSSEAAELSGLIEPGSISVLHGPQSVQDAVFMASAGLRPVINSLRQAKLWRDAGGGACDLMIDTGINRLGLTMADIGDELVAGLEVVTLMSHLASADEDSPLNGLQLARWQQACAQVSSRDASLANSAGIVLGEAYHGTLTRPGLSLYGGVPRAELSPHIRRVLQPQAVLMQVRNITAGESIGYNATFTASQPMRAGVVAIGYADGYLRTWSSKGMMKSGAAHLPVLGRVSMDMTVIDLAAAPHLVEGDWVDVAYDLPFAAQVSGLSQYELLTSLGRRFQR